MNIMKKLTLKSLKMNRSRTIVTIIGIMLSVALITVIACLLSSTQKTLENHAVQSTGNYDIMFMGDFKDDDVKKISSHRDVEAAYETMTYCFAHFKESISAYNSNIEVFGIQKDAFTDCFGGKLKDGRFPENSNEIIIPSHLNKLSKVKYNVGDTMELDIGASHVKAENGEDFYFFQYMDNPEQGISFEVFEKKEFKIVGIIDYLSGDVTDHPGYQMVYTVSDYSFYSDKFSEMFKNIGNPYRTLFVRLKPDRESSFCDVIAEILGIDAGEARNIWKSRDTAMSMDMHDHAAEVIKNNDVHAAEVQPNYTLLDSKLITTDPKDIALITGVVGILFLIVILSSVFIIRNSFAISITEKTKLYGMLSSVGATPRQIKRNVHFEGFVLGLIGIPLGVLLGIVTTLLLTKISGNLLYSFLKGVDIAFSVSLPALLIAVLLGIITIFFSAQFPAARAARIAPIEAIRSNKDIKISDKKKEKSFKTPKLITKLFGMGGSIAWKNLKRSKKKYRTTVISIVVSIAVFITVSSFVGYVFSYTGLYFTEEKFDLVIGTGYYYDGSEDAFSVFVKDYETIAGFDNVDSKLYYYSGNTGSYFEIDPSMLSDEMKGYNRTELYDIGIDDDKIYANMPVYAFDEDTYAMLCEKAGASPEKMKDKAVFLNFNTAHTYDDNGYVEDSYIGRFLKDPVGKEFKMTASDYDYPVLEDDADESAKQWYEEEKNRLDKVNNTPVVIGAEINDMSFYIKFSKEMDFNTSGVLAVSRDWLFDLYGKDYVSISNLYLKTSDSYGVEEKIREFYDNKDRAPDYVDINNYVKIKNQMNSLALVVQIFVYGFIAVISLIGITNIFNTITANMRLRSKEFAMLRSVGMTGKEFDRMIALESFFYTFKSLLIGVPVGLIGSLAIYYLFSNRQQNNVMPYSFPWIPLLISFAAVLIVIWAIMMFSIRKVRRQNIIETIRNDNI